MRLCLLFGFPDDVWNLYPACHVNPRLEKKGKLQLKVLLRLSGHVSTVDGGPLQMDWSQNHMGLDWPCLPPERPTRPCDLLCSGSLGAANASFHPLQDPLSRLAHNSPLLRWISTRSSLPSEALADIRRFCTYGFVYPRSSSPSTWWWASSPEPRRRTAAEAPTRAQWPEFGPRSRGTWTSASCTLHAPPLASRSRTTGPRAFRVTEDGCTARTLSRAPRSLRYMGKWKWCLNLFWIATCTIYIVTFLLGKQVE